MTVEAKICGLVRPEDARMAEAAGADYLGVVLAPGFSRRRSREEAAEVWAGLETRRAGVFVDQPLAEVASLADALGLAVIQLHGAEAPAYCEELGDSGPWVVWKAVAVKDREPLEPQIERYGVVVDGVLLEGWNPAGGGGAGTRFDWSGLTRLRAEWPEGLQLILAGGLNSENLAEAVRATQPHVVDVSSGVESELGRKDPQQVRAFLDAVRSATG